MNENAKRNIKRINMKLKPLVNIYTKDQKTSFKDYKIFRDKKPCNLEDVDFTRSAIFICKEDFSSYLAYYGILKINNVKFPDETESGAYSVINTSFMVVNSQDIRFSKIPIDSFYDMNRDGKLPESWNSINYVKKDLCVWRLVSDVGIGDNDKMYEGCYSWISERYRSGKLDWIFYVGSPETFVNEYTDIAKLNLPIYLIKSKTTKKEETPQIKSPINNERIF